MSRKVTLCDSKGVSQCGSEGHLHVDGRFGMSRTVAQVREYRERFRKHFPEKLESWTHFFFDNQPTRLYPVG